nr:hypothetical protein [uncultured Flavobacterium sp.]
MKLVSIQSLATIMLFGLFTSCDKSTTIYDQGDSTTAMPYPREFFLLSSYTNEISALVSEIKPGKDYDYWSYIGEKTNEFGDKKLKTLINMDSVFKARRYSGKVLTGIKNGTIEYYGLESISRFLGKVDNITEAFLIAESYGYTAHKFFETDHYYVENGNYILRLSPNVLQCQDCVVEVTVTKDGFLKSRFIEEIK